MTEPGRGTGDRLFVGLQHLLPQPSLKSFFLKYRIFS